MSTVAVKLIMRRSRIAWSQTLYKLGDFTQMLYDQKYDAELCEWKMKSMSEWDAALEEVYVKHFG